MLGHEQRDVADEDLILACGAINAGRRVIFRGIAPTSSMDTGDPLVLGEVDGPGPGLEADLDLDLAGGVVLREGDPYHGEGDPSHEAEAGVDDVALGVGHN